MITEDIESAGTSAGAGETCCPGCGSTFICRVHDVTNCQCYNVPLRIKIREKLGKTSQACLCRRCLEKADLENQISERRYPKQTKPVLEENLHYYMEGNYFVFTEHYHRERGYCCKNNCRHCPYGNRS